MLAGCLPILTAAIAFPEEIISQCVWLYFSFCLSLRDVELMMAARGVQLSYERIRRWCDKFGQSYAAKLKRRRPKIGDKLAYGRSVPEDQWRPTLFYGERSISRVP
jgi:transposase-like protein